MRQVVRPFFIVWIVLMWRLGAATPASAVPVQAQALNAFSGGKGSVVVDIAVNGADLHFQLQQNGRQKPCQAQLALTLSFRRADGVIVYEAQWTQALTLDDSRAEAEQQFYLRRTCLLPAGAYILILEAADPNAGPAGSVHLSEQPFTVRRPLPNRLNVGDIALLAPDTQLPFLRPELPASVNSLKFQMPVLAPAGAARPYTVRSILFRKAQAQESDFAQNYLSVLQQSQVQTFAAGNGLYSGSFMVEGLQPGEYLLEIYVFDEETIVAESACPVVLTWRGLSAVLADVDQALRQLEPVAGDAQVAQWLALPDTAARRAALLSYWAVRNADSDRPTEALERYYRAIDDANRLYGEPGLPGYRTPRGRTFVLYGPPPQTFVLNWGTRKLERWVYARYHLQFVFVQGEKGEYRLW